MQGTEVRYDDRAQDVRAPGEITTARQQAFENLKRLQDVLAAHEDRISGVCNPVATIAGRISDNTPQPSRSPLADQWWDMAGRLDDLVNRVANVSSTVEL